MTMREKFAAEVYAIKSNNCLVPFADQGDTMRADCYAGADRLLDLLTVPPTEAMTTGGLAVLRGNDEGPATGGNATYDPRGWYRRMVTRVWETMVRAMIEEGKPPPPPPPKSEPCPLHIDCCWGKGHEGPCCDIPF